MNTQINRHNAPFYEAVATTGIGVEDTLKAITKLVLNSLAAKYRLEAAPQAEAAAPASPRPAAPPAARPVAAGPRGPAAPPRGAPTSSRPSPIPVSADPEDLALEALDGGDPLEEPAPSRPAAAPPARPAAAPPRSPASPPRGAPAPARPAPLRAVPVAREAVLDLDDAIDLPTLEEPPDGTIDLGQDLLQELDEPPAPPPARQAAAPRPEPSAARARTQPAPVDEPIDLGEPLDLESDWDSTPTPQFGGPPDQAIDLGHLSLNQERTIDVPLVATVDGRPVRLSLRLTVRLSR
jgi:hypothetical protein